MPDTTCPAAAFLTQTVALNDCTVKFEIWDTAGQARSYSLLSYDACSWHLRALSPTIRPFVEPGIDCWPRSDYPCDAAVMTLMRQ